MRSDSLQNAFEVFTDVAVPESNNHESQLLQMSRPVAVFFDPFGVLSSIYFDDQSCRVAVKIDNISVDRYLSPKAHALDLLVAQTRRSTSVWFARNRRAIGDAIAEF
jgi:hypothetical protein